MNLSTIPKSYILVVCEKPASAIRIGQALGTCSFQKIYQETKRRRRLHPPIFLATTKNGLCFVICSAIGHLYGLYVKGSRNRYPVFDPKWVPIGKKKTKTFQGTLVKSGLVIGTMSLLSQKAANFIHACDYDQEGEVIGYNILEYACNHKYEVSLRAKLPSLTDEEIRNSFDNLLQPNRRLAEAGRLRHMIDFIYGVNVSRGLTESFKASNDGKRYYNLSMGRVQGPVLAFVVDREMAIRKHIPVPYWGLFAEFGKNGHKIKAQYYLRKIGTLDDASSIVDTCSRQDGKVIKLKVKKATLKPPNPFNLGDLQKEAYRVYRFSPTYTQTIAEKLYLGALISYPRTSSQKLPSSINYRKIVLGVSQFGPPALNSNVKNSWSFYRRLAVNLLSKDNLFPNEGSKIDPAHTAIYPTGEKPKRRLDIAQQKLFDLIIRRFLETFGNPAVIQHTAATILVSGNQIFKADGRKIIHEGWMHFYGGYHRNRLEPIICLPELHRGEVLRNISVTMAERFTQPNFRFNQASLIEKMENERIGTKSTRSGIIKTLFDRNYIGNTYGNHYQKRSYKRGGEGIEATDIGFEIIQSMRKYIPDMVSAELTRSMEEQLEGIELGKVSGVLVRENAIAKLKKAILPFKDKEREIGNQITEAVDNTGNKKYYTSRL